MLRCRVRINGKRSVCKCLGRSSTNTSESPVRKDIAFAFDIDGVLLRSSKPLPRARQTLALLQQKNVPFVLLTNGGGKSERDRVDELSRRLELELDPHMFVQSHTPFAQLVNGNQRHPVALGDKTVLVVGGDGERCRRVAEEDYGFRNVIIPADLICNFPALWPFASLYQYQQYARDLSKYKLAPRHLEECRDRSQLLKFDAILVFNDPRDWALDVQIILDLLMSNAGYLGSWTDSTTLGGQQQPQIFFSNPDLVWAAEYHLPRLGQGGFREALDGVWNAVMRSHGRTTSMDKHMYGKPHQVTYEFAENCLHKSQKGQGARLQHVYMVGDNPASDIRGANTYQSPWGSSWHSILVKTGVYNDGDTISAAVERPRTITEDVWDAVQYGLMDVR